MKIDSAASHIHHTVHAKHVKAGLQPGRNATAPAAAQSAEPAVVTQISKEAQSLSAAHEARAADAEKKAGDTK